MWGLKNTNMIQQVFSYDNLLKSPDRDRISLNHLFHWQLDNSGINQKRTRALWNHLCPAGQEGRPSLSLVKTAPQGETFGLWGLCSGDTVMYEESFIGSTITPRRKIWSVMAKQTVAISNYLFKVIFVCINITADWQNNIYSLNWCLT